MKTMRVTNETLDTAGKDLPAARKYAQDVANRVGAARGDRVATLSRLWHSPRRFSYGVRFELPGDVTSTSHDDGSVSEGLEQFLPQKHV